jgi:H+/gluconate symporter-like permease
VAWPSISTAAFMAPADVPEMPSISSLGSWLAFRGWSALLLAPAAALLAAPPRRRRCLAHWTQTFIGSAARFLAQFFPLFLLGTQLGNLMEDMARSRRSTVS